VKATNVGRFSGPTPRAKKEVVPSKPFRILDAPFLRDDFYCSTLAYSVTSGILAVGLGHQVYLWSEGRGVDYPPFGDMHPSNYVTSLSFSSEDGGRSILAVARRSGQLSLWCTFEKHVRFEISHPNSITCVAFKPKTSRRVSERLIHMEVNVEEIVVGDELGNIWYYSVEWSGEEEQANWKWNGSMTLLAKICAHNQQICGLTWSPDQTYLATGGNDNVCLLFELNRIVPPQSVHHTVTPDSPSSFSFGAFPYHAIGTAARRLFHRRPAVGQHPPSWVVPPPFKPPTSTPLLSHAGTLISGGGRTILVPFDRQKHRLHHSAAVKAIAFAPWHSSLLATGGGSNDRAIHFYHTRSGACLAKINVFSQVTSLIWSQTRREIAATFGYAQPDHSFRIAVFAWPSCAQVAVVPWGPHGTSWNGPEPRTNTDCGRALWAIRYPGKLPRSLGFSLNEVEQPCSPLSQTSSATGTPSEGESGSVRRVQTRAVTPKEKEGGMWCARTVEEGCIIVASSDQTVKFHEVWTGRKSSTSSASGLFGGSSILEGLEGIEKSSGEVIR
jgi:WD40 repeat protein